MLAVISPCSASGTFNPALLDKKSLQNTKPKISDSTIQKPAQAQGKEDFLTVLLRAFKYYL